MATFVIDPKELVEALVLAFEDPRVLDALARAIRAREPPELSVYAKVREFAERQGVSTRTVLRWIRQGMPASRVGNVRRVEIAPAEAWLRQGGHAARIDEAARRRAARAAGLRVVSK